jgi:hypothetical protein
LGESKRFPELLSGFRENAFDKHRNGSLGGYDLYQSHVAVIRDSGFVNSSSTTEIRGVAELSPKFVRDLADVVKKVFRQ